MRDSADPLHGWSSEEVERTSSGPAIADIYGKLFYHIRANLKNFLLFSHRLQVSFRLFQVNASKLLDHLGAEYFSRIEVRQHEAIPIPDCQQIIIHFVGFEHFRRRISRTSFNNWSDGAFT